MPDGGLDWLAVLMALVTATLLALMFWALWEMLLHA